MGWIETINTQDWDGELHEIRDRVADPKSGNVDHIIAIHSLNPRSLVAHQVLYESAMRIADGLGVDLEPWMDDD